MYNVSEEQIVTQQDLFSTPPPEPDICANNHRNDINSREAHKVASEKAPAIRAKIVAYILKYPASICEHVEIALGLPHQTASARISELKRDGRLRQVAIKKTTSGCNAAAYEVVLTQ